MYGSNNDHNCYLITASGTLKSPKDNWVQDTYMGSLAYIYVDDKNNITSLTIEKWKKSNEYKQNEEYKKDIERYKKKYKNYKITPSKIEIDRLRLSTEYKNIINEEKYNAFYKRSNFTIRKALKEGSYEDKKGKITFDKNTGDLYYCNNNTNLKNTNNINDKGRVIANIYK